MGQNGISERPVSLWRNRDYLLLWLGQAVSSLGTGISQFAFPLLILALTHSFAAAGFAVSLLAPSLGGVLLSVGKLFPFVADGISYLVLLGSLLRIRSTFQEERSTDSYHLLRDVRAGISWLWSHVVVRSLAFLAGYLDVARIGGILIVYAIARQ